MTARERARALGVAVDGAETPGVLLRALLIDRGMPHPDEVMGAIEDLGLRVVEGDVADAACRELRSLLEEFHTERHTIGRPPDHRVLTRGVARLLPKDMTARLNRLATLERGEVPT